MNKFVFSLVCIGLFVACGDSGNTVPVDHPHPDMVLVDHEHPDMVSTVHEHSNALPVTPDEATGRYLLTSTLDVDTCSDPSLAGDDVIDLGEWIFAATSEEYLFMRGELLLSSPLDDGEVFTNSMALFSWHCEEEVAYFVSTLSFNEDGVDGDIVLEQNGTNCWVGNDENHDAIIEDTTCTRIWAILGTRQ